MSVNTDTMTAEQIRLDVPSGELGPAGLIRFLQQFETGRGAYSKERPQLLAGRTVEDVIEEVKTRRPKS
jgi:hypothetical protein